MYVKLQINLFEQNYEAHMQQIIDNAILLDSFDHINHVKSNQKVTYLVPFLQEQFPELIVHFRVPIPYNELRTHHNFAIQINYRGNMFVLAERRHCKYLAANQKFANLVVRPSTGMRMIPGEPNESCDDVCAEHRSKCSAKDMLWPNDCDVLRSHFNCKACITKVCLL